MMTNEIPSLTCHKYSIINFWFEKIIWHLVFNMTTNEILCLSRPTNFRIKFWLEKIISPVIFHMMINQNTFPWVQNIF
jgi:hypothetical protein